VGRVRRAEDRQRLGTGGLEDDGERGEDVVDLAAHPLGKDEMPGDTARRDVDRNVGAIPGELAADGVDMGGVQRRVGTAGDLRVAGGLCAGRDHDGEGHC
jgi:hypothetical protein